MLPVLRGGLTALVVAVLFAGGAHAQSMAVDPSRPVRGSCGEVLQPLFSTFRAVPTTGPVARIEVEVTTVETAKVRKATARVVSSRNFDQPAIDRVLAAFVRAYERPEQDGCTGVLTRRPRWVLRKGATEALWTPDDPTIINRPVAATTLPDGQMRIELLDPVLAWSRLQRTEGDPTRQCFGADALRDNGVLPPISAMPRGVRYQIRFRLEADGSVGQIRLPDTVPEGTPLARALEGYVRSARYYPQISEACRPEATWLTIVTERS